MNYKKGKIVKYDFPKTKDDTNVLFGEHMAVVLHSRETPYRTILLAPITSSSSLKAKNKIPDNYLELKKEDYPFALEHDSYINLDMIASVDGKQIDELERYSKKIDISLSKDDVYKLDFRIALTYELQEFFLKEKELELKQEVENIVEYIDTSIKEKVEKIKEIAENEEVFKLIIEIIDNDLIDVLKTNYLK